ncbi:MAG: hypothetical protein V4772_19285, partial [Pseudomonadota bacterium]
PGRTSTAWKRIWSAGPYSVLFCAVSTLGLLFGFFTGTAVVIGRSGIYLINFVDTPVWFAIAMVVNAVVAIFAGGYCWFRVLGR